MPTYRFKAIDGKGKISTGSSSAPSLEALSKILKGQGLFLMEGKVESGESPAAAPGSPARAPNALPRFARPGDIVPLKEVASFTSQLAIMSRSDLPLLQALEILGRQQSDPVFATVLKDVARSVREGRPLSAAMAAFPKVFDEVYISLLAAGEAGGQMSLMMERIAAHLHFQQSLREKVRSALVYPTIVVLTTVAVVAFLVLFILPTFMEVFSQFDIELPLPTKVLILVSDNVRSWWILYALMLGLAWGYARRWITDPVHTRSLHTLQLDLPVAGRLARSIILTRVLRTLGALTAGGVPILRSLELARASSGNRVFDDIFAGVAKSASEGRGLAVSLAQSPYIPETVVGMVATGEKTGNLPEVLAKLGDYYEAETDTELKNLFAVLEPLFVLVLGLLVGGIAVSVLLPIFEMSQGLQ